MLPWETFVKAEKRAQSMGRLYHDDDDPAISVGLGQLSSKPCGVLICRVVRDASSGNLRPKIELEETAPSNGGM